MLLLPLLACGPTQERADSVAAGIGAVVVEILDNIAYDVAERGAPEEAAGTWTASPYGEGDGRNWAGSAAVTLAAGGEPSDLCGADPCVSDTFDLTIDMDAQILDTWGCWHESFEPFDLDGTLAGTMAFERLPVQDSWGTRYIVVTDLAGTLTDGTGNLAADLRFRQYAASPYTHTFYSDGTVGGRDISTQCEEGS